MPAEEPQKLLHMDAYVTLEAKGVLGIEVLDLSALFFSQRIGFALCDHISLHVLNISVLREIFSICAKGRSWANLRGAEDSLLARNAVLTDREGAGP